MKSLLSIMVGFFTVAGRCVPSVGGEVDIQRTELHVKVLPEESVAAVDAHLNLSRQTSDSTLTIMLSGRAQLRGVWVVDGKDSIPLVWIPADADTLRLQIPERVRAHHILDVFFSYNFPLPGRSLDQIYLDRGYRWYPMLLDDVVFCHLMVEAPAEYLVFGPGDAVPTANGVRDSHEWQTAIPIFKIPLVLVRAADYVEADTMIGDVMLRLITRDTSHCIPGPILQETGSMFAYLQTQFGAYPHRQFVMLEMPGMEGANIASGFVLIGPGAVREFGVGEFEQLELTLAMQWFGAGVFGHFLHEGFWFLSLSLPHAVRSMYTAETLGEEKAQEMLNTRFDRFRSFADSAADAALADVDMPNTPEKGTVLYAKGPFVLDRARSRLGDDIWLRFLKGLYSERRGQVIDLDVFLADLSKDDPTDRATSWLRTQLHAKGVPSE